MEDFLVNDDAFDAKSADELFVIARTGYPPNRARAIAALARKVRTFAELREAVGQEIMRPDLIGFRLMGTITVAQVGVAALLGSNDPESQHLGSTLLAAWPESSKEDLLWFLGSQKIDGFAAAK